MNIYAFNILCKIEATNALRSTLIHSLIKPGGIMLNIGHSFNPPMKKRELPKLHGH